MAKGKETEESHAEESTEHLDRLTDVAMFVLGENVTITREHVMALGKELGSSHALLERAERNFKKILAAVVSTHGVNNRLIVNVELGDTLIESGAKLCIDKGDNTTLVISFS